MHVPATGSHGGVVVRGTVERDDLTVNSGSPAPTGRRQRPKRCADTFSAFVLVAATAPVRSRSLRQGCLLVPDPETVPQWRLVKRDGARQEVELTEDLAQSYALKVAKAFGVGEGKSVSFDKKFAQEDAKQADKKSKAS